ncbi:glycosyltransferase family 2 protein, partial [Acuticoccus yangtzensis]|uniref:glycosyltransferase family 2 protein n=1 Tax=Acuticoccus yangtzensis TaxID=1443441 RepID=UPI001300453E
MPSTTRQSEPNSHTGALIVIVPCDPATTPAVSIVVPTFRRAPLLFEAVRSVLGQTMRDLEVIVVDDDGDDRDTLDVIATLACDGRVRYLERRRHAVRGGGQTTRNVGLAYARGRTILFLDDDDILLPHCLKQRLAVLEADPNLSFVVGQCRPFHDAPAPMGPLWRNWDSDQDDLLLFLANAPPWQTSGPLWRRASLDTIGGWDEDLSAGHDYEFHLRALAAGLRHARIDVVDYGWRRPRADSFSSFEAFKSQHRAGDHVVAFVKGLDHVGRADRLDRARAYAAGRSAVRFAVCCRHHGGSRRTAMAALDAARRWSCLARHEYVEASACIAGWIRIADHI